MHFNDALQKQHCDLNYFILLLNNLYDRIYLINSYSANGTISVIKSRIKDSEFHDDQKRKFKLEKLIKAKSSTFETPKVTIYNHTDLLLPTEIQRILEKGINRPIGGYTNKKVILAKFEEIWVIWKKHALEQKLDIFQINHIKSELFLAFEQLKNCSTKTEAQKLKSFLDVF